jgi:hypothetical protein
VSAAIAAAIAAAAARRRVPLLPLLLLLLRLRPIVPVFKHPGLGVTTKGLAVRNRAPRRSTDLDARNHLRTPTQTQTAQQQQQQQSHVSHNQSSLNCST